MIRDDRDFENHLHYIHFNPVKHGLVKDPVSGKMAVILIGKDVDYIRLCLIGTNRRM